MPAAKNMKPKLEIIAPVGNLAMLAAAINAGADAVYFGVKQLNMRISANNFELSQLRKVVEGCHKNKVKAYLCLNTIVYDSETAKLRAILNEAKRAKVDAVIAWDIGVLSECRRAGMPIHLSTQASVSNFESLFQYYKMFKIKRAVLARELSLEQIELITKKIKEKKINVGIEAFVHGAMCVSVSGRCFTSQFLFGRSANRGDCLQPCRREYKITDEEGNELSLGNNYVMSAKDLCTLPFIDKLIDAGITSFKIEGRSRSPEYVKAAVECYREAIDSCKNKRKKFDKIKGRLIKNLRAVYNRDFSSGFYLGRPVNEFTNEYGGKATEKKLYSGKVRNFYRSIMVAEILIEDMPVKIGDKLIIIGNKTGVVEQNIRSMELNHKKIKSAGKGQRVAIKVDNVVRENDRVFAVQRPLPLRSSSAPEPRTKRK